MINSGKFSAWLPRAGTFWILVLLLFLVASRLPLVANGYGSDSDSWRNVVAALHMHDAGRYIPSRMPGFPFFEGLLFLLAPGGWVATNLAAIAAGLLSVLIFARLLTQLRQRNSLWPWVAFAFGAPLMVTTSQTMDYNFGLAFFLGGYLAAIQRRYLVAGVMLGLATACRPSYVLINAAMLVLLLLRRENWKAYAAYAVGFAPLVVALFVPVVISPEAEGLTGRIAKHTVTHVTPATFLPLARASAVFCLGKFGTVMVVLAVAAVVSKSVLGRFAKSPGKHSGAGFESVSKDILMFEVATILAIWGFYLVIPYSATYLLPLVPIVLIMLARLLPRYLLVAVVIAVVAEPMVSVQLDEKRIVRGKLFEEVAQRSADLTETHALLASKPDAPTVYVVGRFMVHRLLVLGPELERTDAGWAAFVHNGVALRSREHHVAFAATLDAEDRARLIDQGWAIQDLE
jgi:hypothetical protein